MDVKWLLLIACEASFWLLFVSFLVLRYRVGREAASVYVLVAIVLDHVALLALGIWDYAQTGHVNAFTLFVVGLLVYALTVGKRDMKRLDGWAKRRLTPRSPARPAARSAPLHRS